MQQRHDRRPGMQQAATAVLLLVGGLLFALTLVVCGAFWRILSEAEQARDILAPSIAAQQQQAVLAAQLSRQAEVVLNSRDRVARRGALQEAEELAGGFAAVIAPEIQIKLDGAIHAVRRSAYRADLSDALQAALAHNAARSHAALRDRTATVDAYPGTASPDAALSTAFRLHALLQGVESADSSQLDALEADYRRLLASPHSRAPALYGELVGSFAARREVLQVRAETASDTAAAHRQLQELSDSLAADAASRTAGMADAVVAHSRRGLWIGGGGLLVTALLLAGLAALLRRHVLRPVRRAAAALETVQRERKPVRLPPARLREVDALSQAVESFGDVLAELQDLAHIDPLTGLANRRLLLDHLEQALAAAQGSGDGGGGGRAGALLYLDLDGFKQVNDAYGHRMGDRVLAEAAERLRGCLRHGDLAARVGGDEFTVVLAAAGDRVAVGPVADRIIAALAAPFLDGAATVGVSVGVAFFPADGENCEALLHRADAAMYVAKRDGKGCWRAWSGTDAAAG